MGEVYRARDASLERDVAIKVLPPSLVRSEERVRRFVLEARSASSLNHPNIVTIYEIGEGEVSSGAGDGVDSANRSQMHFISMELVSGDTLAAKIHDEKTDLRTLLGWLAQAAEGVAKAHAAGIVHRDLKPGNIMISNDGYAKVLDFGLAKLTEKVDLDAALSTAPTEIGNRTTEGVVLGTVGYMSPEQVRGKGVDARTDIFSLGCILYEAATRRRPFAAESSIETMHQILNATPTPIEERNPEVPAELRRLIRRCLAKSADQRLQSVKDLAIELREIVDDYENLSATATSASGGSGSTVAPTSGGSGANVAPSVTSGAAPPRRIPWIPIVVTAVVIAAATLGVSVFRKAPSGGGALPELKISSITSRSDVDDPVISPDGRYLAFLAGPFDAERIYVRQIATGSEVEVLPPQTLSPESFCFSPDGDYLFYLAPDPEHPGFRGLYRIPSLGGQATKLIYDVDSQVSFSPDGTELAFGRGLPNEQAAEIQILNIATGQARRLIRFAEPEQVNLEPEWSPDGKLMAIIHSTGQADSDYGIALVDVASGKVRRVPQFAVTDPREARMVWLPGNREMVVAGLINAGSVRYSMHVVSIGDGKSRRLVAGMDQYSDVSASADGRQVAALRVSITSNLWSLDPDAPATPSRQLTFTSGSDNAVGDEFQLLADGTVVYQAAGDERLFLSAIAPDGTAPRSFRDDLADDLYFLCRPGAWFVQRFDRSDGKITSSIWRFDADGTNRRRIGTGSTEILCEVSPDGRTILMCNWGRVRSLIRINADGGDPKTLTEDSAGPSADISPDGRLFVYRAFRGVGASMGIRNTVRRMDDGSLVSMPELPISAVNVDWILDSNTLAFIDRSDPATNVFRFDIRTGATTPLTSFTDGRVADYNLSPDGRRLAITRYEGDVRNLWLVDMDGGDPIRLTHFLTGDLFSARWTPDGRRIIFVYGDVAQDAVMVTNFR